MTDQPPKTSVDHLNDFLSKTIEVIFCAIVIIVFGLAGLIVVIFLLLLPELCLLIILVFISPNHHVCRNSLLDWKCQRILLLSYPGLLAIVLIIVIPFVLCYGIAYSLDYCKKKFDKGTAYKKEELNDMETAR